MRLFISIVLFMVFAPHLKLHAQSDNLQKLVDYMTGSFNSAEQAKADSSYFEISLHMQPIWTDRKQGHWLYVEQAASSTPDKPYRQRVYQVEQITKDVFKSNVYLIPEENRFVGGWKDPKIFNAITQKDLQIKTGCAVILQLDKDGNFTGGTEGKDCESNLRGAKYATSRVTVTKDTLISWDQGFDASDKQVWGATKGGYYFKKIK